MKKTILGFLLATSAVFADDVAAPVSGGNLTQTLVMIGFAVVFFYFILWRPEQKRRKALEQTRSSMKKGDRATAMGIIGTIVRVQENTVILKMVDGSQIEVLKAAISEVQSSTEEVKPIEVQNG